VSKKYLIKSGNKRPASEYGMEATWKTRARGLMELVIDRARKEDIDEIMGLYFQAYGADYPLEIGTNEQVMQQALDSPEIYHWYVIRDTFRNTLAASGIVELDLNLKIGKVTGVTVGRNYQGRGIANRLIGHAINQVFQTSDINSLYATSRTVVLSSQSMLIKNGFIPLGIFPNARKIKTYETLTLMGKFRSGILTNRTPVERIPKELAPLAQVVEKYIGTPLYKEIAETLPPVIGELSKPNEEILSGQKELDFEFITAPNFVQKRFKEFFGSNSAEVFYPFHYPNLIIAESSSGLEMFACFTKKDHYCVIMGANKDIKLLGAGIKQMIFNMQEHGIYYLELLIRLDNYNSLVYLLDNLFIPSAIYPAMREVSGEMYDYVLMTRTLVPLDFTDIKAHPDLIPYFKNYTEQWSEKHLKNFGEHIWRRN